VGEAIISVEYRAALNYVLSFADYERVVGYAARFDLKRMKELLKRLNHPHQAARSIHIAGTKGKGSTAAMIASVLSVAGYRTGLYTSPHLHTLRERIRVADQLITEEEFAAEVETLKPHIEAINRDGTCGELTTFEILTALAFSYFKRKGVDFQVLEVGLGGRLDATNVVSSEVCALTSISFDHTEVLGETLAQIATEKASIIKPGSWVISAPQHPEAAQVIEQRCRETGARLIRVGSEVTWHKDDFSLSGQTFRVKGMDQTYKLTLPLLGDHQLENAAIAVASIEALTSRGATISPEHIVAGLSQVSWPGRLQVLRQRPWFIVDGAHNADSARRLRESLKQYFDFSRAFFILGTSVDKDISGIAAELARIADGVIVTRSRHPRAASVSRIAAEFASTDIRLEIAADVPAAVEIALSWAAPQDLICTTGSLFIVAEAIEYLQGLCPEPYPGRG
jgi:dihydrofolate synthase/folylpolyglutamate synthase